MIKFSRGALNRPRHDTPFCNSLCNPTFISFRDRGVKGAFG
jgi:hypothetical protein